LVAEVEEFWAEAISAEDRDLLQVCGRTLSNRGNGVQTILDRQTIQ
jgi:hypothetical protein